MTCSSRSPKGILETMTGRVTSASFVGREEELGRLHGALRSAAAGTPAVLLVGGEAGVGKTRLLQEFADQVGDEAKVLLGSCVNVTGGGLPYGPVVDALRALTRSPDPPCPRGCWVPSWATSPAWRRRQSSH
jgi:AAA ATPase domain